MTDEATIEYRTKDLNQAAFMWCQKGAKLRDVQGTRGTNTTIFFVFELAMSQEELKQLLFDYANGDTRVEPQDFITKQGNIRDMLHSALGLKTKRSRKQE